MGLFNQHGAAVSSGTPGCRARCIFPPAKPLRTALSADRGRLIRSVRAQLSSACWPALRWDSHSPWAPPAYSLPSCMELLLGTGGAGCRRERSRLVLPGRGADHGKRSGVDLYNQRSPGGVVSVSPTVAEVASVSSRLVDCPGHSFTNPWGWWRMPPALLAVGQVLRRLRPALPSFTSSPACAGAKRPGFHSGKRTALHAAQSGDLRRGK